MNNPIIYIGLLATTILLSLGFGVLIGTGIGAMLFMAYAIAVDCTNGLIKAIQGVALAQSVSK